MSRNGKKPSEAVLHVRPFKELAAEAKTLGFQMLYDHQEPVLMMWPPEPVDNVEQAPRMVGVVGIRLEPVTTRAREALRRSSDDPLCDGYESHTKYLAVTSERLTDPVAVATQDTAVHALSLVRQALDAMP